MSTVPPEKAIVRVSTAHNEPVTIALEGGAALTIRVEVDSMCTCQGTRAGSYIDSDLGTAG